MNPVLFKDVFGKEIPPTDELIKDLAFSITALPENISNAMFLHYANKKSIADIAAATGQPTQLVERWLRSGIAMLQVFHGVNDEAGGRRREEGDIRQ